MKKVLPWPVLLGPALLILALLGGCERLNPSWCDKAGRCAAGQVCNPSSNTCESRDATPDILSHRDYPWPDGPGDGGQREAQVDGAPELGSARDSSSAH